MLVCNRMEAVQGTLWAVGDLKQSPHLEKSSNSRIVILMAKQVKITSPHLTHTPHTTFSYISHI